MPLARPPTTAEWTIPSGVVKLPVIEANGVFATVEYLQAAASPVRSDSVVCVLPKASVPEGAPEPREVGVVSARTVKKPVAMLLSASPDANALALMVKLAVTTKGPL